MNMNGIETKRQKSYFYSPFIWTSGTKLQVRKQHDTSDISVSAALILTIVFTYFHPMSPELMEV